LVKFAFDTNLYIRSIREAEFGVRLRDFYARHSPRMHLCSVVVHELLIGANSPERIRDIHDTIVDPAEKKNRIITPTHSAWDRSAQALSALAVKHRMELGKISRSLVNDALIAASCAEAGVTLLTDNLHDFKRLSERIPVRFAQPWPMDSEEI